MFGKISFKTQVELVSLKLDFVDGAHARDLDDEESPASLHSTTLSWPAAEPRDQVLARVREALEAPSLWQEFARLTLHTAEAPSPRRLVHASSFHSERVRADLTVQRDKLVLHSVEVGAPPSAPEVATLSAALRALPLASLGSLRWRGPGAAALWADQDVLRALGARLTRLDLAGSALGALPASVGALRELRTLDLTACGLKLLPPVLGSLTALRSLHADGNDISLIPGELARCASLRTLSLEGNRLTHVPLNFAALRQLRTLSLLSNPLEVLPEIGPCAALTNLSVANLRVTSSLDGSDLSVQLLPLSGQGYGLWGESRRAADRLRPIFELMLRRSAGHHPILSRSLRHLAASDPKHRTQMVAQEGALQQLLLMALSDSEQVACETCATLALLASHGPELAEAVAARDVSPVLGLLRSAASPAVTLAALRVLCALALTSTAAGARVAGEEVLDALEGLCTRPGVETGVLAAALEANATVQRAVGRAPMQGRGVRILSMDGGGMKLEARTGRRVHELFDLIVGTSTGGLLAVALALRRMTLDECEAIYKVLGQRVFSRGGAQDREEGWMDSFYRNFHSRTQHVRAVVVGYKHDSAMYEELLKDYCDLSAFPEVLGKSMIDSAPLDCPRVALVATLASVMPATPFVFRNYEVGPELRGRMQELAAHGGSSRHAIWQAARASSAATYYLDGFECGAERFQDGAVTINNPALVALQEAQLLWPGTPLEVLVSIGTGSVPCVPRPAAVSSFMETGNILIESATDVERVAETLAATAHLIPGLQYFRLCEGFSPMDARCQMALDEIRQEEWAKLEAATEECIQNSGQQLDSAAAALMKEEAQESDQEENGQEPESPLNPPPTASTSKDPPAATQGTSQGAGGGLSEYLTSWFSPSKGGVGSADAARAEGGTGDSGGPAPSFLPQSARSRKRARRAVLHPGAASGAGLSLTPLAAAVAAALPPGRTAAVVLDLPVSSAGDLVLSWRSELHAVLGGSPAEAEWEARCGQPLAALFSPLPACTLPGGDQRLSLLSQHAQVVGGGRSVELRLMEHVSPGRSLSTAEASAHGRGMGVEGAGLHLRVRHTYPGTLPLQVGEGALAASLAGSVVFLTRTANPAWVAALLRGGTAAAVVAPAGERSLTVQDLGSVWPLLVAGQPLLPVLQRHGGLHLFTLGTDDKVQRHT
ncbi:Calcium-independent phospholipase A2-gamma [Auxenochlorella protothecoides]|uniref:Patatin n=1 Tax=Auxenochlorella protothecoides TaxID=3075 RepID=A0A087SST7_AUXPR|nr:Calcium-independent phospholipase A2-gamma [Auxenochlorella protothecoides]KFM28791.1 Calcium-independent phospholipase A2-gamma [Auxenochlorella protothecoides]